MMNMTADPWLIINETERKFSLDNSDGKEKPFNGKESASKRAAGVGVGWRAESNGILPDLVMQRWERCHY